MFQQYGDIIILYTNSQQLRQNNYEVTAASRARETKLLRRRHSEPVSEWIQYIVKVAFLN